MSLYWVDCAILTVIGLSIITGLFRGLVKELIALCVWALAIWLAFHYSQVLEPWFEPYCKDKTVLKAVCMIAILIGTLIVGGIFNAILGFVMRKSGLSGTDRVLGMGFGFVRGVCIVALILVVVKLTSLPYESYRKDSVLYAKFDPLVDWISAFIPDFIKQVKVYDTTDHTIEALEEH